MRRTHLLNLNYLSFHHCKASDRLAILKANKYVIDNMLSIAIEKFPTKHRQSFLFFIRLCYGIGCLVLKSTHFFISEKYKSADRLVDRITFVMAVRFLAVFQLRFFVTRCIKAQENCKKELSLLPFAVLYESLKYISVNIRKWVFLSHSLLWFPTSLYVKHLYMLFMNFEVTNIALYNGIM